MHINPYRLLSVASILTILICVGIFLYTQWELKRFNESLPKAPITQATPGLFSTPREEVQHQINQNQVNRTYTDLLREIESETVTDSPESAESVSGDEVIQEENDTLNTFFQDFFGEIGTNSLTDTEFADSTGSTEKFPFDVKLVKAGYDDYNAYLTTDPDYAYQRLDDAFREQFGNSPDVDIVVETIKRSNNGNMTFDDAINHAEAFLRLITPLSPPGGIQEVESFIAYLKTSKQLALEEGAARVRMPIYRIESD